MHDARINASWHQRNPMPRNATLDQRVAWHLEHSRECGCREIPQTVSDELKRQGARLRGRPEKR